MTAKHFLRDWLIRLQSTQFSRLYSHHKDVREKRRNCHAYKQFLTLMRRASAWSLLYFLLAQRSSNHWCYKNKTTHQAVRMGISTPNRDEIRHKIIPWPDYHFGMQVKKTKINLTLIVFTMFSPIWKWNVHTQNSQDPRKNALFSVNLCKLKANL